MPKKNKEAPQPLMRETPKRREVLRHYAPQPSGVLARLGAYLRRNWVVVRSCLIFAGCLLSFIFIYSKLVDIGALDPFFHFTARATGAILNHVGTSVQVNGNAIISSHFYAGSMLIVANCTALIPIVIFISAVLAFPSTAKQKLIGIVLGIVGLFALNLVRTVSLFFIGSSFSQSVFEIAHMLVWQSLMIILAVVLWLVWVGKLVRVTPH
jgi:exosortase H (IPTLxxWG-CTERM-specific)